MRRALRGETVRLGLPPMHLPMGTRVQQGLINTQRRQ